MKRAKLLKAVSIVMVVAMMMFSTTGAFAAVIATQDATSTTVNVEGTVAGATPYVDGVTVMILKPGTNPDTIPGLVAAGTLWSSGVLVGAGQATITDASGAYECEITLEDNATNNPYGNYVVVAMPSTPAASIETGAVYFASSEDKIAILKNDIINNTNAANLVTKIELNKGLLLIDTETLWDTLAPAINGYQQTAATAIIEGLAPLRNNLANVTLDDMEKVLKVIAEETYAQAVANSIETDIDELGDYADITKYNNFVNATNMTNPTAVTASVVGSGVSNFADLLRLYKEEVIFQGVLHSVGNSTTIARNVLDNLAVDAGMTNSAKYKTLSDVQKQQVAEACKTSGATTFALLDTAFNTAVAPLTPPSGNVDPGAGTGGGATSETILTTPTPTPTATPIYEHYKDINDVSWAWEAIEVLTDNNVISGYGDSRFAPSNAILREEFIKIAIVGLIGEAAIDKTAVPSFTDAQNGWFAPYLAAAESNKLTAGIGNGLFGIGDKISRQDMAVMLYRMLKDAGIDLDIEPYAFTDADQIADYAVDAVYALKNMNIISGDPEGTFRPTGETTRAEAAVLLFKTLNKLGKLIRK